MKTDPKDPTPNDPTTSTPKWKSLLGLFFGAIVYSAMQSAIKCFDGQIDFTKSPGGDAIGHFFASLKDVLILGGIRGVFIGVSVIVVFLLGGPLWSVLGPFVAAVTTSIANFVGAVSRAVKSRNRDDNGQR